jgi:hypothetical protein
MTRIKLIATRTLFAGAALVLLLVETAPKLRM